MVLVVVLILMVVVGMVVAVMVYPKQMADLIQFSSKTYKRRPKYSCIFIQIPSLLLVLKLS